MATKIDTRRNGINVEEDRLPAKARLEFVEDSSRDANSVVPPIGDKDLGGDLGGYGGLFLSTVLDALSIR